MNNRVLEERREVLEGWSTDLNYNVIRVVPQEEEEERSNDFDHTVTQSVHQEEEVVLLVPIETDSVFRRHTVEYVGVRFPWIA